MSNTISNPGFDPKDPGERILIGFNFADDFASVAASPAPVVTVTRFNGEADATPSAMKDGAAFVTGAKVKQWVIGGVVGCRYLWRCDAYGPDGQLHTLAGTMLVRTA